jgi:magnesium transporter
MLGCFSLNIRIPRDGDQDHLDENGNPAGFTTFGCIVGAVFLVSFGMVTLIRWWRWNARKKFSKRRGVEVPSEWDGYWGWK